MEGILVPITTVEGDYNVEVQERWRHSIDDVWYPDDNDQPVDSLNGRTDVRVESMAFIEWPFKVKLVLPSTTTDRIPEFQLGRIIVQSTEDLKISGAQICITVKVVSPTHGCIANKAIAFELSLTKKQCACLGTMNTEKYAGNQFYNVEIKVGFVYLPSRIIGGVKAKTSEGVMVNRMVCISQFPLRLRQS